MGREGGGGDNGSGNVVARGGSGQRNKRGEGLGVALSSLRRTMTMTKMGGVAG